MKQAFVDRNTTVTIRDTPIPTPKEGQLLIRVVVSGTNPKDWKLPQWSLRDGHGPSNEGDDIAGYVEAVGEGVVGFSKGDKVAAFHEMLTDDGSFAEYAIAHAYTTFHLPAKTSFEGKTRESGSAEVSANMIDRGSHHPPCGYDRRPGPLPAIELALALEPNS